MKSLQKKLAIVLLICGFALNGYSTNYTSAGAGPAAWNVATSWTPNGIPGAADNVTIAAGHTITINTLQSCKNLTVTGTLKGNSGLNLQISGNYIVNGSETGNGAISFYGAGSSISGTGTFAATISYTFAANSTRTIAAGTTIIKTGATAIAANAAVTNLGNITLGVVNTAPGAAYTNSTNASLTLTSTGFMTGRTFNSSASGNTVSLKYVTGVVPTTTSGYYNLTLSSGTAGAKTLPATTIVANNLTINALNTLNSNSFDLSVGGNWTNNGTFTQGTRTVTLNGTGAQAIAGTASTTFYNLIKNAAGTATLSINTIVSNALTISSGIFNAGTFGLSGTGSLTMTGGELRLAKTPATLPELTGAYSLTAGKVTFNGAGAQTIKTGFNYFSVDVLGSGTKTLSGIFNVNGSLNISSTLDVTASNFAVNLKGNWTNTGTFNQQTGTVSFIGTAAQTISGTSTTFDALTINNTSGVTITSGNYTLNRVITLSNGNFNTGSNSFTMISTATQTARIAPLAGTGSISGNNFIVQRFITARDTTYADFASPVQSSTITDWGNELPALSYTYAPPNQYPSAYTYDETGDQYVPVSSGSTVLTPGQGFEIFLSGDYSYANLPNTTINTIGTPNQGNQDLSGLISNNAQGWNLVGNPFASNVSWSSIYTASGSAASGLYDYIEMYDYTIQDWHGYTSADAIEIGSTQGFWVYGLPGAPSLTLIIRESAKTTTSNSSIKALEFQPYFTLNMASTGKNLFSHTFKIAAKSDASDGLDNKDIPFRASPNKSTPALYSMVGGKKINVNTFNSSNDSYSLPLKTQVGVSGSYTISAAGFENISDYTCIKLEDKSLNKMIDLTAENVYSFTMNTGDNSDRFIVHFSKNSDCRSLVTAPSAASDFTNETEVLPTESGNQINFNYGETTSTTISVVDLLGQTIVNPVSVEASTQSVNIALPEGFSGMYLIRIESAKGMMTKKFVRK